MKKLDIEQREALTSVIRHHGFIHVMEMIQDIMRRIESEVMTVPLPADPEKASLALYAKRMQAEGVVSLWNAFNLKINELKREEERERLNER